MIPVLMMAALVSSTPDAIAARAIEAVMRPQVEARNWPADQRIAGIARDSAMRVEARERNRSGLAVARVYDEAAAAIERRELQTGNDIIRRLRNQNGAVINCAVAQTYWSAFFTDLDMLFLELEQAGELTNARHWVSALKGIAEGLRQAVPQLQPQPRAPPESRVGAYRMLPHVSPRGVGPGRGYAAPAVPRTIVQTTPQPTTRVAMPQARAAPVWGGGRCSGGG